MKRLLLYTTTGCGGSERLATSNPPSYRVIFLLDTNPNCSVTSVLFERRALLFRSHARDTVVSNLVKQYRYCSQVLPVHVQ